MYYKDILNCDQQALILSQNRNLVPLPSGETMPLHVSSHFPGGAHWAKMVLTFPFFCEITDVNKSNMLRPVE